MEKDYSLGEQLYQREYESRIEELIGYFENKIDSVIGGERKSAVLFEGDFIFSTNKLDIGHGFSAEPSAFFTRFISAIVQRGSIISTNPESGKELLKGKTDGAKYFRGKFPGTVFPVDRITYLLKTDEGPNLMIYAQKFYSNDSAKKPIIWRWVAEDNQLLGLVDNPTGGKEKVLIPA